jgi:predicted dehydrogenase
LSFNYRRIPAVLLARDWSREGSWEESIISRLRTSRIGPPILPCPIFWRFDQKLAGAGSVADKGSHIIDLARFLVGEMIAVAGMSDIFIKERASSAMRS